MKKIVFLAIISLFILSFSTQEAHAYTLLGGKQKTTSIRWQITVLKAAYVQPLHDAIDAWDATSTPLSFTESDGTQKTQIFVSGDDYGNTGWNAQCTNFLEFIFWGDYVDSSIQANYTYMVTMSNALKQGVFAHEIGHALGLGHVTDPYQVMCTSADGRAVNVPGSDDIAGVNYLY